MPKRKKKKRSSKSKRSDRSTSLASGGWMRSLRGGFQRTVRGSEKPNPKKQNPMLKLGFQIVFWGIIAILLIWGFSGGFSS